MRVSVPPLVLLVAGVVAACLPLGCPSTQAPGGLAPSAPWRDGGLGCVRSPEADGPTLELLRASESDVFLAGACTFHRDSRLGIVIGEAFRSGVQFRLFATGLDFAPGTQ